MRKVSIMLFAFMFILSSSISAQISSDSTLNSMRQKYERRWTAENRAKLMADKLQLSNEEKAEVEELFKKQDEERAAQIAGQRAKRESLRAEREARRAEMKELREKAVTANNEELEKIIGKEKLDQWKKYQTDSRRVRRPLRRMY